MAFTHKPNRGSLFNAREKKKENSPDMTGTAIVNGAEVRISGWWQESKGNRYLSLSFSEVEAQQAEPQQPTVAASDLSNFDDGIPF